MFVLLWLMSKVSEWIKKTVREQNTCKCIRQPALKWIQNGQFDKVFMIINQEIKANVANDFDLRCDEFVLIISVEFQYSLWFHGKSYFYFPTNKKSSQWAPHLIIQMQLIFTHIALISATWNTDWLFCFVVFFPSALLFYFFGMLFGALLASHSTFEMACYIVV